MDNANLFDHLASTAHAADTSTEIVTALIRSYYREMEAAEAKWRGGRESEDMFSEVEQAFHKYWLPGTRFTEYWRPSRGNNYIIVSDDDIVVFQDMLGNFVVLVTADKRTMAYLLSIVQDSLKIVNAFFR